MQFHFDFHEATQILWNLVLSSLKYLFTVQNLQSQDLKALALFYPDQQLDKLVFNFFISYCLNTRTTILRGFQIEFLVQLDPDAERSKTFI